MYYLVKCMHDLLPVSPKFVDQTICIASTGCAGSLEPLGLRIRTSLHPKRKCLREIPRMVSQPFLPRSSERQSSHLEPPRRFRRGRISFRNRLAHQPTTPQVHCKTRLFSGDHFVFHSATFARQSKGSCSEAALPTIHSQTHWRGKE